MMIYRSYKGTLFEHVADASMEYFIPKWAGMREVIVYRSLQSGRVFVSPKKDFFAEVSTPEGKCKRFEVTDQDVLMKDHGHDSH
jgi:hypothetical protein